MKAWSVATVIVERSGCHIHVRLLRVAYITYAQPIVDRWLHQRRAYTAAVDSLTFRRSSCAPCRIVDFVHSVDPHMWPARGCNSSNSANKTLDKNVATALYCDTCVISVVLPVSHRNSFTTYC